jgi:hypothetical protein
MRWKFFLNFVLGGLAIVSIVGGLLWFLIEQTPESALAFVGGLVLLFGWWQTRDDKKEQAQDKAEIIDAIRADKYKIPVEIEGYISDKHREADLRLLRDIWGTLNSDNFARFEHKIDQRSATFKDYDQFDTYTNNRNTRQWMGFHNEAIESALKEFDAKFIEFNYQFWQSHGRDERNSDRIQPNDKQRRLSRSEEKFAQTERAKALNKLDELKVAHSKFVKTLKNHLPEFDFSNTINNTLYQSDEQRESDKRLFRKLAEYIDSNTLLNIYHDIYNRTLRYEYYSKHIAEYQRLRQTAEHQFINNELEEIFKDFDQLLSDFDNQLSIHSDLMDFGSTQRFVPHYKLPEVKSGFRFQSDEVRQEKIKQHQIDIHLANELRQEHGEMTGKIKRILPEVF